MEETEITVERYNEILDTLIKNFTESIKLFEILKEAIVKE